jgi:hypothetical protein
MEDTVINYLQLDDDTDEIVRDAVNGILIDCMIGIDDAYVSNLEIPIATHTAMQKLKQIVTLSIYPMDGTITKLECLEADRELAPSCIDAWARGVVPTRPKVQSESEHLMARLGSSVGSGTPSVSSYRSGKSGTKISAALSGRSGMHSREFSGSSTHKTEGLGEPEIFDLDDDGDRRPSRDSTSKVNAKFEKLRKAQRRKLKNTSILSEIEEKDEFELIKDELERGKKGLKTTTFAIDSEGHPVPISVTKPEELPKYSMTMATNVSSFQIPDNTNELNENNIKTRKESKTEKGNKQKEKNRNKNGRGDESYFIPSKSLATVLSETGPNDYHLNAGVSIKTGDVIIEGPAAPAEKMSRKEFLDRKQRKTDKNGGISIVTGRIDDGIDGGPSIGSFESDTLGSITRSVKIPDLDPLEGGRKSIHSDPPHKMITDRDLGLGPVNISGRPNPTNLPKKPNSKQRELVKNVTGGMDKAGPRDRLPPTVTVSTADRKHLPPPESGKTIGHGMMDSVSIASSNKGRLSPSKNSIIDSISFGGDNSTILTGTTANKRERGEVKVGNVELARALF